MSQPTGVPGGSDKEKAGEKNETSKIDIVAETQPSDNVALPLPATPSTYQRVEKGTRTALLYWDGWLSAQDARLAEDDPEYFSKTGGKPGDAGGLKRNLNLKKNWTYGKNGEIIYINTGFVGLFDKEAAAGQNKSSYGKGGANAGSSYGLLGNSAYGKGSNALLKQSGPSVGTHWDLKGRPGNQSAYADVTATSSRGGAGGRTLKDDDKDYYGKSGGAGGGGNRSSYGSAGGGRSGPGSAYMEVGGSNAGGGAGSRGAGGAGYGLNETSLYGGYNYVDPKDKNNKYAQKRKVIAKKNFTIGPNGEIIYIPTGFVGIFDKQPAGGGAGTSSGYGNVGADGGSSPGGAGYGSSYGKSGAGGGGGGGAGSSYGSLGHSAYGKGGGNYKSSGPSVGNHWDLKGKPGNNSAYMEVGAGTSSRGGLGGGGGRGSGSKDDNDYYSKSGAGGGGANRSSYGSAGGGRSGPGSAYMEVGGANYGGSSGGRQGGAGSHGYNGFNYAAYSLVDPKEKDNKYAQKRKVVAKKNFTIGPNGEIIYIPTGFVGLFDKQPGGGGGGAAGSGGCGSASCNGDPSAPGSCGKNCNAGGGGQHGGHGSGFATSPGHHGGAHVSQGHGAGFGGAASPGHGGSQGYGHGGSGGAVSPGSGAGGHHGGAHGSGGSQGYGHGGGGATSPGHHGSGLGSGGSHGYGAGGASSPGHHGSGYRSGGGGGATPGSSYGLLGHSYGKGGYHKASGPSVGTHWDLKGKHGNNSAYADVASGPKLGMKDDDKDYYGKSGAGGSAGSAAGSGGGGTPSGPHRFSSYNAHGSHGGGKANDGSAYMVPGGAYGTRGAAAAASSGHHGGGHLSINEKLAQGAYAYVNPADKDNKWAQRRKYLGAEKKNWYYNPKKEIVYVPTGFVGLLDKDK